jgi:hypothetical protein
MKKNAVICAIEQALEHEGCNEVIVAGLYERVKRTRGNLDLSIRDFLEILKELEKDGLFERFGDGSELTENSLVARSQMHPSVPYGKPIQL